MTHTHSHARALLLLLTSYSDLGVFHAPRRLSRWVERGRFCFAHIAWLGSLAWLLVLTDGFASAPSSSLTTVPPLRLSSYSHHHRIVVVVARSARSYSIAADDAARRIILASHLFSFPFLPPGFFLIPLPFRSSHNHTRCRHTSTDNSVCLLADHFFTVVRIPAWRFFSSSFHTFRTLVSISGTPTTTLLRAVTGGWCLFLPRQTDQTSLTQHTPSRVLSRLYTFCFQTSEFPTQTFFAALGFTFIPFYIGCSTLSLSSLPR